MFEKKAKAFVAVSLSISLLLLCCLGFYWFFNSEKYMIYRNAAKLQRNILNTCNEYRIVELTEITPFDWDKVFFFSGYTPEEYIYEKVGYKWSNIARGYDETAGHIVFLLDGKVVCHVVKPNKYYSMVATEDFFAHDNPQFIVSSLFHGHPNLVYLQDDFISQFDLGKAPSNLVGRWEGSSTIGNSVTAGTNFTLTEEGVLYGRIRFDAGENSASGYAQFTGVLVDGVAYCQTFSTGQSISGTSPLSKQPNTPIDYEDLISSISPPTKPLHIPVDFQMELDNDNNFFINNDDIESLASTLIEGTSLIIDEKFVIKKMV